MSLLASRKMFKKQLIELLLCLAVASWIRIPRDTSVQAILMQKARICFNSMSTSFQSECVYCDSKLYASTITACTGQPNLANNVTQAQAFCIATACLQVPVSSSKTRPLNILIEESKNSIGRLFPGLSYGYANKRKPSLKQRPVARGLLIDSGRLSRFLNTSNSREGFGATLELDKAELPVSISTSSGAPELSALQEGGTDTPAPESEVAETPADGGDTTGGKGSESLNGGQFPNFNQMYSQIYNSQREPQRSFMWRPFQHYLSLPGQSGVIQPALNSPPLRRPLLGGLWWQRVVPTWAGSKRQQPLPVSPPPPQQQ